ncbi:MAG: DUF917 family protein [Firmicutes bacterium]|nr:DUF917 family protein [Bacillota bacterium]
MSRRKLDSDALRCAVIGGSFYGGGGGGAPAKGMEAGEAALLVGDVILVDIDDVPDDAVLLTMSAVGAPAAKDAYVKPYHYLKAVELLMERYDGKLYGFITNECGGAATVNGWIQAAAFGLPVVDAPCNGRAHPTGVMGSMGLHSVPGYVSLQTGVGGDPERGTYLETVARGSIEKASAMIRQAAVQAGGLVAVARNPVTASFVRQNGAPGAIGKCIEVGRAILEAPDGEGAGAEAAAKAAGGRVAARGMVSRVDLTTTGGFDVGSVAVVGECGTFEMVFWNEYMTLEQVKPAGVKRLATFPDLIATVDAVTGHPVSSAEIREGQNVCVVVVDRGNLSLGAGVKDPALYVQVEQVTGKEIIRYVF